MSDVPALVADNLDIWTGAVERKGGSGRGGGKRINLYGIERLRELILDLAVHGKLVQQRTDDESASALLTAARKKMAESAKAVQRLRWKPSRKFDDIELKRTLPSGWALARVNDTGFYINGLAFKPTDWTSSGRKIIRIQNLTNPEADYNFTLGDFPDEVIVRNGDILVSWSATLAAFQWWGDEAVLNQHIFRVIHEDTLTDRAFLKLLLSQAIKEMAVGEHAHGLVMTHINRGPFLDHVVAIPPFAEQLRIVAKVDELMALCDALEQESEEALAAHQQLVETLLATLTASTNAADLATNWSRLEAHFDTLFATEASIEALKSAMLHLAVGGKLTPQDIADEPASNLVARCRKACADRARGGEFRHPPPLGPERSSDHLPAKWAAARLGDIVRVINGRAYSKPELLSDGTPVLRVGNLFTSKEWYYSNLELEPDKYIDDGDLIYAWSASFGPFIWKGGRVIYHYHIWKLEPFDELAVSREFLCLYLQAETAGIKASGHGIAMLHMTKERMEKLPLDLPPLAEQHRIVAKVDELMALCDALKAGITDAAKTCRHLADAIVEKAAA